jgi:hypothetical protein
MSRLCRSCDHPVVGLYGAFDGMTPAVSADHARWVVDSVIGGSGVTAVVPAGFAAYARILHPLPDGERWEEVAPSFLGSGDEPYDYPYADPLLAVEGDLGPETVDALAAALAASARGRCHFGLWDGWGWLHAGAVAIFSASTDGGPEAARAQEEMQQRHDRSMSAVRSFIGACPLTDDVGGGREMRLFNGPIGSVRAIGDDPFGDGSFGRQSPQWWWPLDRTWFVATEIDYPWTYLAGTEALVADVLASLPAESTPIAPSARW